MWGASAGGVGDWVTDTVDGLLTAITDPYKTVEHVTGFAAYIEEVLPGMLEEIGGEWKQIWTEGSPEDQVRFCSYALTEVASWFIGVGEVRTAAASAKAAAFADELGRFVKWSKYFNRVDDVRHAGRVASYTDQVGRFMTMFTDDISRQVSQNVDNAGRYLARIGKGAGNWVDNAGRGVSKMDFGDLRRWLRESLEDANERAQRMFDPELAGPEGWRMKMSEADEMLGGKKPAGPGEVNGGAGVEIKGGVEPEEIAKVVDGPGNPREVNIHGKINSELDEVDLVNKVIYEDKNASKLYMDNPDFPQTEQQWAKKQIFDRGSNRINALQQDDFKLSGQDSNLIPDIQELKDIKDYVFRVDADTPELRAAVQAELDKLKIKYPDYNFSATYGGNN